ncbi:WD repeat-containing protein 53-like [Haliotis asinina]|uniref:WD repeat-containing protein 53-like n=1 Tax=Haliotis asinina TaxID=109174 RepID=UPI003531B435
MAQVLNGGHTATAQCVDVQATKSRVATGGENGELCLWSLSSGELLDKYVKPDTDCTSVLFSKSKPNLLYAAFGQEVLIFDTDADFQIPIHTFQCNQEEINQIQMDDKEDFLAACDDSGEIKVINVNERKVFKTLRNKHTNICSTLHFRPGKPWDLYSGGLDCKLIHWDFAKLKALNQFSMQEMQVTNVDASAYMVNPPFVHHIDTSPNGKYLACALENGQIEVFDTTRRHIREIFSLYAHGQGVSQVSFLNDDVLVSGGNDCQISLWDLNKSEQYQPQEQQLVTNGHGAVTLDTKNASISELCKIRSINHSAKINWLKPYTVSGQNFVAAADQTSRISLLSLV